MPLFKLPKFTRIVLKEGLYWKDNKPFVRRCQDAHFSMSGNAIKEVI